MDGELPTSPWGTKSEFWVRNPGPFIDIAFDVGCTDFVFTEKIAKFIPNMRLNPEKLLQAASRGRPWRAMIIEADNKAKGYYGSLAVEYGSESWFERPVGVYPMWSAAVDDIRDLVAACEALDSDDPIGSFFGDTVEMSPLPDQRRCVLFRSLPQDNNLWNHLFREISAVKRDYPDIDFHFTGGKSVTRTIGMGVDAFDHPVRTRWIDGWPNLILPNGREVGYKDRYNSEHKLWADLIGRSPQKIYEIEDRKEMARAMYEFNLVSLKWVTSNYDRVWTPSLGGLATDEDFDADSPDTEWQPRDDLIRLPARLKRERFDRWICDVCTLALSCPYARPGAVCIVEDSPTTDLVKQFKSRRASDIIDGLSTLVQLNVQRIKDGREFEIEKERIDPNLTKLIDSTFDRGLQLAKLSDPTIAGRLSAGGTKIQIGMAAGNGGTATAILQASNPQELMAGVMARLEQEGIKPEDATEDDVNRILGAIEATSSDG